MPPSLTGLKQMLGNCFLLLSAAAALAYLGIALFAWLYSDALIFPKVPPGYEADEPGLTFVEADDGERIAMRYYPRESAERLLLYSHGNGEDLAGIDPFMELFQARGVAVLAYDYPGYGASSGRPSEAGVHAAAEAAFQHAVEQLGFPPESIVLYGRSLGSGPSCRLAAHYPVAGLILDGAFSSTFRVMSPRKLLPFDKFDNLRLLPRIDSPVLILHGRDDRVVPFAHALRNAAATPNLAGTLWIDGAGHHDLIAAAGPRYWETVLPFVRGRP